MRIIEPCFEKPDDRNEKPERFELQRKRVSRVAIMAVVAGEGAESRLLYGKFEDTYVNENGGTDIETTSEIGMLDCGHTWQEGMVLYRCWRGHLVDEKHAHRCPSGRVVCEVPGCGKVYGGKWYSSFSKRLLDKTIGCRVFGRPRKRGNEISIRTVRYLR